MRILKGIVSSGRKEATPCLAKVKKLLLERTGLPSMAPGTLNVRLPNDYIVQADAAIEQHEYLPSRERLKLQRCRVRGHRMVIMRPEPHEPPLGNAANVLELVSPIHLRTEWKLCNGDPLEVEVEGDEGWWAFPDPP